MLDQIRIRPAAIGDYATLENIYLVDRQQEFPWVTSPQLADFERDSHHEMIIVATIGDRVVGFLSFYRLANFIHLLFIDPDYRHQGVASQLIDYMRSQATGPMQLKVVIANQPARDFYARLQFREVKRDNLSTPPNITLEDTQLNRYPFIPHD
ncbi:GNAT family N-acetyltransferase [Furfurilactobacillus milii]|uniref:GNAT family N-acetyltransferase n=1 Tax=Furfurilactobacillus milii TaxID=2888272 RepID=A0A6N9I287_9LACO|nr:GNAT family N-acetyltransferase [Furfurilactobacillus milii]MYV17262.1 GNAT family N-acetyltransferase [Furfurilactobacillus milii]